MGAIMEKTPHEYGEVVELLIMAPGHLEVELGRIVYAGELKGSGVLVQMQFPDDSWLMVTKKSGLRCSPRCTATTGYQYDESVGYVLLDKIKSFEFRKMRMGYDEYYKRYLRGK